MAKKIVLILFFIFLWLLYIGQLGSQSALYGDINLIDEGQFAAWISHMMHGKVLYKDFYLQYGPLQIIPLAFFTKLLGVSFFSIRLYLSVFGALFGIFVSILILRFFKIKQVIQIFAIIFLILVPGINIRHWIGIFTLFLLILSFSTQKKKIAFSVGVFLTLSFLESTEVGVFTATLVALYSVCKLLYRKARKKGLSLILHLLAGLVISGFIFVVFAFQQGWLLSYLRTTLEVVTSLSGVNLPNGQGLPSILPSGQFSFSPIVIMKFLFSKQLLFYWSLLLLLIFLSITIIRYIERKATEKDSLLLLLICFGLLAYASIIGRSGHYMLLFPIVLVCGSYFISLIHQNMHSKDGKEKLLSIFFIAIFLLYGIRHAMIYRQDFLTSLHQRQFMNASVFRVAPLAISQKQSADITKLQEFINKETKPSDPIYVFNNLPGLYFLLDRENATQYDLPLLAFSKKKRQEIVSSLEKSKPKFIIEDKNAWAVDDISDRQRQPEVIAFILKKYTKRQVINGHLVIYERSDKR